MPAAHGGGHLGHDRHNTPVITLDDQVHLMVAPVGSEMTDLRFCDPRVSQESPNRRSPRRTPVITRAER